MALNAPSHKVVGFPGHAAVAAGPRAFPVRFVLRLQQTVGNREVVRLLVARPASETALVRSPQRLARPNPMERIARWWRRLWRRPAVAQPVLPDKPSDN